LDNKTKKIYKCPTLRDAGRRKKKTRTQGSEENGVCEYYGVRILRETPKRKNPKNRKNGIERSGMSGR